MPHCYKQRPGCVSTEAHSFVDMFLGRRLVVDLVTGKPTDKLDPVENRLNIIVFMANTVARHRHLRLVLIFSTVRLYAY